MTRVPVGPPRTPRRAALAHVMSCRPDQPGVRPLLNKTDLEVLGRYGEEHDAAVGDVLFADGDETYDLIVVLEGEVAIVEGYGRPTRSRS